MLWSAAVTLVHRTAAVALAPALLSLALLSTLACEGKSPADPATTPAGPATTPAGPATTPAGPATAPATAPAHGYGDKIAWRGLDEGFKQAAALGRPLMLVVHAAWCPRCKELKKRFFDPAVADTSGQFVMVNLDQDHAPEALLHGPDGQYIPRILFFDAQGHLDADLSNPGRSKYKYFYSQQDDVAGAMQRALDRHPHVPAANL